MKIALTVLFLALGTVEVSAATAEYCQVQKATTKEIDQLRFVELPYKVVESSVVSSLLNDDCIRSRLTDEEIYTLSQMLLSFENNGETAESIIGEFLAL